MGIEDMSLELIIRESQNGGVKGKNNLGTPTYDNKEVLVRCNITLVENHDGAQLNK